MKKLSCLIHIFVVATVYAVYYSYPPYHFLGFKNPLFWIHQILFVGYGALAIIALHRHLKDPEKKLLKKSMFFFFISFLLSIVELVRDGDG